MSLKQQLYKYTKLNSMSSAPKFILSGNEETLEVKSTSVTGNKIKQYIESQRDDILVKLKEDINNL